MLCDAPFQSQAVFPASGATAPLMLPAPLLWPHLEAALCPLCAAANRLGCKLGVGARGVCVVPAKACGAAHTQQLQCSSSMRVNRRRAA